MSKSNWEKFTALGCSHGNHIDREAEKVAKQFVADWKPKHRVHLGDLWDLAALRKGASPEERQEQMSYDYNCGMELLDWYKPQYLTLGNHDFRLWRAAKEYASHTLLAEMLTMKAEEAEDEFRKRRIQWTPWGVDQWITLPCGGPKFLHGYRSTVHPAKAHFENWGPCITSHVHKPDTYIARHADGGEAHTTGCLADLSKLSYANGTPAKLGWRNGFAYGMINKRTGAWKCWHVVKEGSSWISPHGVL